MTHGLSDARAALLRELSERTYVMLRPSPVAGVGVFAVRDIPKGCRDMLTAHTPDPNTYITLSRAEVEALPSHAQQLIENYCLFDADQYYVPERGFKTLDLVCFLNHDDTPNVASVDDGAFFEALRDIHAGEELLVDYGKLVDDA